MNRRTRIVENITLTLIFGWLAAFIVGVHIWLLTAGAWPAYVALAAFDSLILGIAINSWDDLKSNAERRKLDISGLLPPDSPHVQQPIKGWEPKE